MEQGFVQPGAVLAGRYRVDRVLGQGGMGLVVAATHLHLQQAVAVKVLLPEVLANQEIVQRFLREAQAAVRLRSEHVARVLDVGTVESGAPYMVLEYLDGADLSNFPRFQLSVGGVVDLILQACEALAEAHSVGIVHRDIKPANFFITRRADGSPMLKVLDFGISKLPATGVQLTATQAVMGTPAYMSPEQMRSSRDVDHRSDIWSLGVVLYELLQGAPPFTGDTFSSLVVKVITEPLPRLTVPLPVGLDTVIYRCLEKEPARRFQNIAELAQALARYAQSPALAAISVQRTSGVIAAVSPRALSEPGPSRHPAATTISGAAGERTAQRGSRRWPWVASAGALLAVAGVVVASMAAGGDRRGASELRGASPLPPAAAPDANHTAPRPPPAAAPPDAAPPALAPDAASAAPAAEKAIGDSDSPAPPKKTKRGSKDKPSSATNSGSAKQRPSENDFFDERN